MWILLVAQCKTKDTQIEKCKKKIEKKKAKQQQQQLKQGTCERDRWLIDTELFSLYVVFV